jgi:two-component system chemotaxis response regulator CheB
MSGTRKAHAISKIYQLPTVEAVVIGCSAGGLSALQVVLAGLPKGVDAAFIIVAHTPPDGDNLLPKLLDSYCALPVTEAIEREPVIPGRVYIAPPNYHLLIEADHTFALSVDDRVCYSRPAVDILFMTAADVYREHLMGVVLTGANNDGAHGLQAVKNVGGITLVQDPATAYVNTMPLAAIATGAVDHVLALQDISVRMLMYCAIHRSTGGEH